MTQAWGYARFTPSVLGYDTLEELFVHREDLVSDAISRIERAASSRERSSRLFIGPRGAGKSHLLALVAHRARRLVGFGERFQLAWLPEDLWAIGSVDDLFREIARHVEPAGLLREQGGPPDAVLRAIASERGPIVVVVENLDQVLADIGQQGQRRLRALMESDRSLLIIGSATRLATELVDQSMPFYGFFDTVDLHPFSVDQAADMLKQIARARHDEGLVAELDTPQARSRLAAVAHLAGGQPRIWALFGAGLTVEGLDDFVSILIEQFDDLTPYYQERLRWLSVNERKAVQALAEADRALPVRDLAEATGISPRSLASTLLGLRETGWVRVRTGPLMDLVDGRLTYYELAEPLARLAFQLKAAHGEPVRLLVDFLRAWFEPTALNAVVAGPASAYAAAARSSEHGGAASALCRSLAADVLRAPEELTPSLAEMILTIDRGLSALEEGDPQPLLSLPASITYLVEQQLEAGRLQDLRLGLLWRGFGASDHAPWIEHVEDALESVSAPDDAPYLLVRALWHLEAGELAAAASLLDMVEARWADLTEVSQASLQLVSASFLVFKGVDAGGIGAEWLQRLSAAVSDPLLSSAATYAGMGLAALTRAPRELVDRWIEGRSRLSGQESSFLLDTTLRAYMATLIFVAAAGGQDQGNGADLGERVGVFVGSAFGPGDLTQQVNTWEEVLGGFVGDPEQSRAFDEAINRVRGELGP